MVLALFFVVLEIEPARRLLVNLALSDLDEFAEVSHFVLHGFLFGEDGLEGPDLIQLAGEGVLGFSKLGLEVGDGLRLYDCIRSWRWWRGRRRRWWGLGLGRARGRGRRWRRWWRHFRGWSYRGKNRREGWEISRLYRRKDE
jgi:hypothetical protein